MVMKLYYKETIQLKNEIVRVNIMKKHLYIDMIYLTIKFKVVLERNQDLIISV